MRVNTQIQKMRINSKSRKRNPKNLGILQNEFEYNKK